MLSGQRSKETKRNSGARIFLHLTVPFGRLKAWLNGKHVRIALFKRLWSHFNKLNRGTGGPRFNEVLRDWGNLFIISRVYYIEHLDLTNFWKNNQNVCYIEVYLITNLQNPAFSDLNNYCNKICSLTPMSQYRAVYSRGIRNSVTGKQNCLKLIT